MFTKLIKYISGILNKKSTESVFFITFHKCASTLFSRFLLKHIEGLQHVNYAQQIYRGKLTDDIIFRKYGIVYGPIRLSTDPDGPVYAKLVKPLLDEDNIKNKKTVFFIRDPRDILISAYYSFGFTHQISKVADIKEIQERQRGEIQQMTIDEYAIANAEKILSDFQNLGRLRKICTNSILLRYEDMINSWDEFSRDLSSFFTIRQEILQELYIRSRPRIKEDPNSPRRSGKTGGYKDKLAADTILFVNSVFKDILKLYRYHP